jgi:hypothetical protein
MVDLEAVGGAATGGLIASQFEKPSGKSGEHHAHCADCGTETLGRFCHNCGNPSHVHRTLLHLGEELLHGVMHFDSRAWRTVPLLIFRPGRLTREWVQGKRARYVSPLALFLFTVFVMFMALSYLPAKPEKTIQQFRAETVADVAQEQADVAKAEARLNAATTSEDKAEAQRRLDRQKKQLADAQEDLAGVDKAISLGVAGDWKQAVKKQGVKTDFNIGSEKLNKKLEHLAANPELAVYKLEQTFYKFSFLLVPISIPFVALLFLWKRGFTLYDHGVFVLYSLTFVSLLIMITALTARFGGPAGFLGAVVVPIVVPVHMYYQLKGAYGLRTFSALWRTFILLNFCFVALVLFALAVLYVGLA